MTPPATPLPPARILVVDDEPDLRTLYELTLLREGHRVDAVGTLDEARHELAARRYDLLITDMRLPDGLGLSLLQDGTAHARAGRTVVVTAYGSADSAVQALKCGAFDYLTKPVDLRQFRAVVATALQAAPGPLNTGRDNPTASSPPRTGSDALDRLIGASPAMQAVKERIGRVASSMAPVMVLGESGTGKEVVARALHACSHRAAGPFVAVNCGAIPETLIEAEFFGARKGAYTGAQADRDGFFAAARGGTLFLDEIGDLPLAMQAKLLRAIQERTVRPLGGVQEEAVDVRILCATHKDLQRLVADGMFRQDLFYRLNVIELRLPALRDRREDLPGLVAGLMQRICAESGQPVVPLSASAQHWLNQHPLDGNVRELENLLHRALALCNGACIDLADLQDPPVLHTSDPAQRPLTGWAEAVLDNPPPSPSPAAQSLPTPEAPEASAALPTDLQSHLDAEEKRILERALRETRGNRTAAAARLGLNLRQIRYRIARLGIQVKESDDAPEPD